MAKTLDGEIEAFQAGFGGTVVAPGDEHYEDARSVWNGAIDRRPAVIARCSSAEEVASAIRFARENNLEISVRGGGHNYSGNAVCEAGLMIHLGGMNSVTVDPVKRLAVCGGGATWAEVDAATQSHRDRGANARRWYRLAHQVGRSQLRQPCRSRGGHS
jgi:FAD/FMN-containing dehydrogenase